MNLSNKMANPHQRFKFVVKWQDSESSLSKNFTLYCYFDDSIELIDTKTGRLFLKRVMCDGVKIGNLFVGAVVDIFSRRMEVIKYGDEYTQNALEAMTEKTVGLLKAEEMNKVAQIFLAIISTGCKITKMKMVDLTKTDAAYIAKEKENAHKSPNLADELFSTQLVVLEITGKGAIAKWQEIIDPGLTGGGDTLGIREPRTAFYGSNSMEEYEKDKNLFFLPKNAASKVNLMPTNTFKDCSLVIIKPHAVDEGIYPKIMLKLLDLKFRINSMRLHHLSRAEAEELFEIYRGVIPEFKEMIDRFIMGPSIGFEISGFDRATVTRLREAVGPRDPDIAKMLRPNSLRAEFGKTVALNAIYCTDLDGDGVPDCQYFFNI